MKSSIVVRMCAGAVASLVFSVAPILAADKGDFAQGESVYKEICFSCHGLQGEGKGPRSVGTMQDLPLPHGPPHSSNDQGIRENATSRSS